jgi:hypothetical protein
MIRKVSKNQAALFIERTEKRLSRVNSGKRAATNR